MLAGKHANLAGYRSFPPEIPNDVTRRLIFARNLLAQISTPLRSAQNDAGGKQMRRAFAERPYGHIFKIICIPYVSFSAAGRGYTMGICP